MPTPLAEPWLVAKALCPHPDSAGTCRAQTGERAAAPAANLGRKAHFLAPTELQGETAELLSTLLLEGDEKYAKFLNSF